MKIIKQNKILEILENISIFVNLNQIENIIYLINISI